MKKQNLKKMAKAITLGLVLGTALTTAQPVWAATTYVKDASDNTVFTYDTETGAIKWGSGTTASGIFSTAWGANTSAGGITMINETNEGNRPTVGDYIYVSGAWKKATIEDAGKSYGELGVTKIANGDYSTAFGSGTTASGNYSFAVGYGSKASGIEAVAMGLNSIASGSQSFAMGSNATASGTDSVAMGLNSTASGSQSFAMGSSAIAKGAAAVAMGSNATAIGQYAFAVGYNSEASGIGSVVIGTQAKANSNFSVAIGYNAKAGGQNSLAALGGVTGVWSGDAYTTGTGTNAVAIGVGAVASVDNSVAIGKYAKADTANSTSNNITTTQFAVGGGNDGTNTYYARITGVADGVNDHDAVTLGQMKNAVNGLTYDSSTKKISYTTFGNSTATELVDLSGLGGGDSVVGKAGEISVSEGTGTDAGKKVIGLNSAVTDAIAGLKNAVGDSSSGLVKDMGTVKGYVTSSGLNANSKKITNVANGTADSDAVNYGQVKDGMKGLQFDSGTNKLSYTTLGSAETQYVDLSSLAGGGAEVVGKADEVSVTDGTGADAGKKVIGLSDEVKATLGEVNNLSGQVSRLGTRISKVGAGAAAMASMHPVYDDDSKLSFSAGLGSYRSEKAVAIGAFYRPNERVVVNLGSTMGNDDNMVGLGVNFALDRNVGVKLPSKAVMARELNELREKTAEQDAKIAQLMAMINALKKK